MSAATSVTVPAQTAADAEWTEKAETIPEQAGHKRSHAWSRIQAQPKLRDVEVNDSDRLKRLFNSTRTGPANHDALLAYTRGHIATIPCQKCAERRGVFKKCVQMTTTRIEFNGCCANCHFGEGNQACNFYIPKRNRGARTTTQQGEIVEDIGTAQSGPADTDLTTAEATTLAIPSTQDNAPVGEMDGQAGHSLDVYIATLREFLRAYPLQTRRVHYLRSINREQRKAMIVNVRRLLTWAETGPEDYVIASIAHTLLADLSSSIAEDNEDTRRLENGETLLPAPAFNESDYGMNTIDFDYLYAIYAWEVAVPASDVEAHGEAMDYDVVSNATMVPGNDESTSDTEDAEKADDDECSDA